MSIERFGDIYIPTCDRCGDKLSSEDSFMDAVNVKKAAGWKSLKTDGEWEDICTDCWEEYE